VSGILVPPENATALAEALRALLEDGERYGSALKERVLKNFSLERMLAQTIALY
jgi:glycosyltransferase involved in cell wall biosynthesis